MLVLEWGGSDTKEVDEKSSLVAVIILLPSLQSGRFALLQEASLLRASCKHTKSSVFAWGVNGIL